MAGPKYNPALTDEERAFHMTTSAQAARLDALQQRMSEALVIMRVQLTAIDTALSTAADIADARGFTTTLRNVHRAQGAVEIAYGAVERLGLFTDW